MNTSTTPSKSIKAKVLVAGIASAALLGFAVPAMASAATYTVCKHGCKLRTIQSAVDKAKGGDTIKVKPGVYAEGVVVEGHKYDNLKIKGVGNRSKVILEGRRATGPGGTNNGIEGYQVDNLQLSNMTARNYTGNGFWIHTCDGFLMDNLVAAGNRSYGLFVRNCMGGTMKNSVGYNHGDSAFYVGETPEQQDPKTTVLTNLKGYQNVLGYSGTNSKYVDIKNSDFYNNGIGLVPNTLDSEDYEPTELGQIRNNRIFWNNLNYYKGCSGNQKPPVCSPIPPENVGSLGSAGGVPIAYPTGIGIVMHGAGSWQITGNQIFGNNLWGVAIVSDPFNRTNDGSAPAISSSNRVTQNVFGRPSNGSATDQNGKDLFWDYAGHNNCFEENGNATMDNRSSALSGNGDTTVGATISDSDMYKTCTAIDQGGSSGINDGAKANRGQFNVLLDMIIQTQCQEREWLILPENQSHPALKGFKPFIVTKAPRVMLAGVDLGACTNSNSVMDNQGLGF